MEEKQLISITGGTGHLGHCLILMLLEHGFTVKALYTTYLPNIKHPQLTWIKGDITTAQGYDELLENSHTLIHSAGVISIGDKDPDWVYQVNVIGTKNLINACIHHQVKMVYISSCAAVLESLKDEIYNEERPYKTNTDFTYDYTKALAEQKVLKAVKENKLEACIMRPTAIIGPPDFRPSPFGKTILDMATYKMPFITNGGYNLVDVRDVSQSIINSIDKGRNGEVYLLSGTYLTIREIAKIANPNKLFISLSINFLKVLLPFIELYKKLFGMPWPLTKESLITLEKAPKNMDNSKAERELNHPTRPPIESINDLLSWSKKQNHL